MFGTALPGDKPDLLTSIENPFQQQPGEEQGLLTTEDVFLAPSALAQDRSVTGYIAAICKEATQTGEIGSWIPEARCVLSLFSSNTEILYAEASVNTLT